METKSTGVLSLQVKLILSVFTLSVIIHGALYISATQSKFVSTELNSSSEHSHLRESNNVTTIRRLDQPDVLRNLNKYVDVDKVLEYRESNNLTTIRRLDQPDVLRNLNEYVDVDKVLEYRKILASIGMTSAVFFHPTKLNTISQLDTIPMQDSCAVIGSSGILKGSSCGPEIDSHDFVVRENMAPVKGFEADVGSKTSLMTSNDAMTDILIRCLTNPSKSCHKKYTDVLKGFGKAYFGIPVYQERSSRDRNRYDKFFSVAKFVNPDLDFRIPSAKFRNNIMRYWGLHKIASGGFVNVNIAFTFCKRLSIYGFFPFSRDLNERKLRYHYYDKRSMVGGLGVHSMPAEYRIYKELHQNHTIRHVIKSCS